MPLKSDNHALYIAHALKCAGMRCSWTYLPVKIGYDRYDEGLAILSLCGRICASDILTVSRVRDYRNWRVRKVLGVRIEGRTEWFYTVHLGRWEDKIEPLQSQWETLNAHLQPLRPNHRIWLLGDFNAPADLRRQGYDLIVSSGWYDSYHLARQKDAGITVSGAIDGWKETALRPQGMRIDYIWCSDAVPILSSRTVFSGVCDPVISDHFGILIETGGNQ